MNIKFVICLITFLSFESCTKKESSEFLEFLTNYPICELPFYSYQINDDKEFKTNINSSQIEDNQLLNFFIKDSSELGYNYSRHAIDDYNVILSGFIKYDYKLYKWIKYDEQTYFVIYVVNDEDNSKVFLSVFSDKGESLSKIIISEEKHDISYTESLIDTKFNIKKVCYSFVTNDITKIDIEILKFNQKEKNFNSVKKESKDEKYFYYEFKKHSLKTDPLLRLPE